MNIFDVIGPVMIGPSSSHTAGVVKIGNTCSKILGCKPKIATITFYGSFAETYVGHGSDKAIIAGLLGYTPFDTRIKTSIDDANNLGYNFKIETSNRKTRHPNTVKVVANDANGSQMTIIGESLGGGAISICKINDMKVSLNGDYNTIILKYIDKPGTVKDVSAILYDFNINIATMKVIRISKGGEAIMLLEVDSSIDDVLAKTISSLPFVDDAKFINLI